MKHLILLISLILLPITQSLAGEDHAEDGDHHHDSLIHLGPIDILGEFGKSDLLGTVPTVSNLHGDELLKRSQNSLGETLANEVGVNSSQFGPNSSRPVIRGLEGDRIRILQNGIGVLDASGTSQDHAVPINALSSESIEIVRGPLNLLYGSSAIGGVVNIVNSRIHKNYYQGFLGAFDSKIESVNQGQNWAGKLDFGIHDLMFHFDGHYLDAQNTQTPSGEIANSESEQHSFAFGTTYINKEKNYLGLSYSDYQNIYGVVSEADVDITLKQQRVDFASYYQTKGFIKAIQLKSAQTFYKHTEIENGNVGTVFDNQGNETRLELIQKNQGQLSGILGLQTQFISQSALGDEAFLPTTDTRHIAFFAFEELDLNPLKINFGFRSEWSELISSDAQFFTSPQKNNFTTQSVALGSLYTLTEHFSTTFNVSLNERAPNYQELYANGAHLAVGIFEQGNMNLNKERSFAFEWSLKQATNKLKNILTAFNQEFNHFINLNPTGTFDDTDESGIAGDSSDDFEIYNYLSQKARINGLEFQTHYSINSNFSTQFQFDYLYGQNLETKSPLPRISPIRLGLGLDYQKGNWQTNIEWRHVLEQTRTAMNEIKTPNYDLFNLGLNYKIQIHQESQMTLYGQIQNLMDEKAQNHVSLLKDRILLPGRNVNFGLRLLF